MKVVDKIASLNRELAVLRGQGRRVAFVPTMGNLHAGHLHLMRRARDYADAVVVSIYVNPLQFGPQEDFATYPRTPERDEAQVADAGVDLLFMPDEAQMYPHGRETQTRVEVPGLSDILCGAFRPGHFRGVTTVVARLLNLVAPDVALFGKKDYQQLLLIRRMVADLAMPMEIHGEETVREADGLAMSSRNGYLSQEERAIAPELFVTLRRLADEIHARGEIPVDLEDGGMEMLRRAGFVPDYLSVRRRDLGLPKPNDRELVILTAARLGRTRLIDNIEVDLNRRL